MYSPLRCERLRMNRTAAQDNVLLAALPPATPPVPYLSFATPARQGARPQAGLPDSSIGLAATGSAAQNIPF